MTKHVENTEAITVDKQFDERLQQIVDQLNETGEALVQTEEDSGNVAPDAA